MKTQLQFTLECNIPTHGANQFVSFSLVKLWHWMQIQGPNERVRKIVAKSSFHLTEKKKWANAIQKKEHHDSHSQHRYWSNAMFQIRLQCENCQCDLIYLAWSSLALIQQPMAFDEYYIFKLFAILSHRINGVDCLFFCLSHFFYHSFIQLLVTHHK